MGIFITLRRVASFDRIVRILLALAIIRVLYSTILAAGYELRGWVFTSDSRIYLTIGKWLFHGLKPYQDLFETKPPGIFLMSGLSMAVAADDRYVVYLQSAGVFVIPILVTLAARRFLASSQRSESLPIPGWLLCGVFGMSLVLFAEQYSGHFQVEFFGVMSLSAYMLCISKEPMKMMDIALATVFLLLAVGLKEPFVLTAAGTALILADNPRMLRSSFFVPAICTLIIGIAMLSFLGYLHPYASIYLPYMFGSHIGRVGPVWLRGFALERVFGQMMEYDRTFSVLILLIVGLCIAVPSARSSRIWSCVSVIIALYLAALAVGIGGNYAGNHFVFAVPVYAALFLRAVRSVIEDGTHPLFRQAAVACIVALLAAGIWTSPWPIGTMARDMVHVGNHDVYSEAVAQSIDRVLDACNQPTFLFLGSHVEILPSMHHPPMGPLFFQYDSFFDGEGTVQHWFQERYWYDLHTANVIVFQEFSSGRLESSTAEYLDQNFTKAAPSCASEIPLPKLQYIVYFRKTMTTF